MIRLAPEIITFDCYGTLVEWHEVLAESVLAVLERRGTHRADGRLLLDTFSRHAHRLEQFPYRPYKEILRASLGAAFADHDVPVSPQDIEAIAASTKRMGPHPETKAVLARLRERFRLAIITNSDDDLIVHNLRLIEVPIDYVITAEQAQAYKPSPRIFEYAHARMGVTTAEVVHVAMSMALDIQACHQLRMRAIWINRLGETGNADWLPYEELPDLRGVPALVGL